MGETFALAYRPPYDWAGIRTFLAGRAIPGIEVVGSESYLRSVALAGGQGFVTVGHGAGDALAAHIRFPDAAALPEIRARLRRLFDCDADPNVIGAHLSADPHLATLVAARPGLRVPGAWDGFELAVRGILGQ
ncbi:AlkA N-terminal domain-containing protein, partial [Methylobacterium trifolii]